MAEILRLPKFSEEQHSANIVKWLKKEGDQVAKGDVLVEIETDKSLMELEAQSEGILLYVKVPIGKVNINDILGVIGAEGENITAILQEEEKEHQITIDKAKGVDVVRLPKLSDMMESARVVAWKVAVGDNIKKGDVIAEVETDKAVIEVESFREGKVLYRMPNGTESVKENEILIIVGEEGAYYQDLIE